MKGYIQNQTIILQDSLPDTLQNGDEVEIVIIPIKKRKYHVKINIDVNLMKTYKKCLKKSEN